MPLFGRTPKPLTKEQIDAAFDAVSAASEAGGDEQAWEAAEPLLRALPRQRDAARALLFVVGRKLVSPERRLEILREVATDYPDDARMLSNVGEVFEAVTEIDFLNSAPPSDPFFEAIVGNLEKAARNAADEDEEETVLIGLACAARTLGRQHDELAERSYRRLVELAPERSACHYNLGLFYKTRGRFAEGLAANQRAVSLADEMHEPAEWNLGICATGAGRGEIALEVWTRMEQVIEMGRFDLPEGRYPHCKVRLAERPLAERNADNDDPGLEETIWIQRLSPCHGIVRSALYQDLGVDYGDVILFDGAPITYHTYGDEKFPVFPHLTTLRRRGYQLFDFAGTQDEAGALADVSRDLERDAIVYSHTEQFRVVCQNCWMDPDADHEEHDGEEKHTVTGRIAAPPDMAAGDLLAQIDSALADCDPLRIYSPALCDAAGESDRARFERRRFEMLWSS